VDDSVLKENESTPETLVGRSSMEIYKRIFFMSERNRFSTNDIKLVDGDTDGDVPTVMENFFMDDDIVEIQTSFEFSNE
jgi:hypothetical protein